MNAEQIRLDESREQKIPWKNWGPYLQRASVGHGARDYSEGGNAWDLFQSRSGAFPRPIAGRRRLGRHLR